MHCAGGGRLPGGYGRPPHPVNRMTGQVLKHYLAATSLRAVKIPDYSVVGASTKMMKQVYICLFYSFHNAAANLTRYVHRSGVACGTGRGAETNSFL